MKIDVFIQFMVDVSLVWHLDKIPSVMHRNAPKKRGRGQDSMFNYTFEVFFVDCRAFFE